jgi:carnitine O-acetyltransferase
MYVAVEYFVFEVNVLIHLAVLVFDNGRSGFLGEHSCMDGTPTLRLNEFILASLAHNKVDLGAPRSSSTGANIPRPTELKFELNATCKKYIDEACQHFDELVGQHDMEVSSGFK